MKASEEVMKLNRFLSKIDQPSLRSFFLLLFAITSLLIGINLSHGKTSAAAALDACTPSGTTYGTLTFSATDTPANPINIPSAGAYNVWVRLEVPSASSSALLLNINNASGSSCYNISGNGLTPNTWTWVDFYDGTSANLIQPSLPSGNNSLTITGTESGVSVDRVEFLADASCIPTGNGDNCLATTAATPPNASVTAPTSGATLSGTTTLSATASATTAGASIANLQFQLDGKNIGNPLTIAPYTLSLNTTTVTNGSHTLTVIATDANDGQTPALSGTSSPVTINVNNPAAPTCTTSTTLPTTPGSLAKTSSTYTSIGLSWSASTPSPNCTLSGYHVYRNGTQIANVTSGTSYTDTGLTSGTNYSYTVQAYDSGSNVSAKSSALGASTAADNLAPNVPTISSSTATAPGSVSLSWGAVTDNPNPGGSGVAGYNIYRCSGSGCTPDITGTPVNGATLVTTTTYADNTVSASTNYSYVVTAVDNVGNESAPSSVATVATPAPVCSTKPSVPTSPTAGATTDVSVAFSWTAPTASPGCTLSGYNIYQLTGSTYTLIKSVTGSTSVSITGLTPNTSYIYAIEAFDTSGNVSAKTTTITIATAPDTTPPTAPASVTAKANSSTSVSVNWSASTDNIGVASYNIYRNDRGSSPIATVNSPTLTYIDNSVAANTSYTYQVSAMDAAGNESAKTSSASVQTPAPPTSSTITTAPSNLQAGVIATTSAILSWSAPSTGTVTGYHVYIDGILDTFNSDNFSLTGGTLSCLAPSVNYTITVKAYNATSTGPAATVVVDTPSGGLPGDFNCDGKVNGLDVNALASNWLMTHVLPAQGDSNGDTTVNALDLNALASDWGGNRVP